MNAAPTTAPTRLLARDDGGGSGGLSTGSIIAIVVVCACVGILVLALFLWRLIVRFCRPSRSAPLPPVQELAHRRGQHLSDLAQRQSGSRPTTWLDDSLNSRRGPALYQGSAASLLPGTPERKSSVRTEEAISAESSSSTPSPEGPPLHPPNPAFFGATWDPTNSPHHSLISTASASSSFAPSPSPSYPMSDSSSTVSHITAANSTQPLYTSTSYGSSQRPMRRPSSQQENRRLSQVSSITTTHRSMTSRASVIHGAPHSRHSNIQIVLPAPLGPRPPSAAGSLDDYDDAPANGTSVLADQWITAGSRNASADAVDRRSSRASRRPSSQPGRNKLHRKASSDQSAAPSSWTPRSASQPRPHSRAHAYIPPPVPRIPEGASYDIDAALAERERGRSAMLRPMSSMPTMQMQMPPVMQTQMQPAQYGAPPGQEPRMPVPIPMSMPLPMPPTRPLPPQPQQRQLPHPPAAPPHPFYQEMPMPRPAP